MNYVQKILTQMVLILNQCLVGFHFVYETNKHRNKEQIQIAELLNAELSRLIQKKIFRLLLGCHIRRVSLLSR